MSEPKKFTKFIQHNVLLSIKLLYAIMTIDITNFNQSRVSSNMYPLSLNIDELKQSTFKLKDDILFINDRKFRIDSFDYKNWEDIKTAPYGDLEDMAYLKIESGDKSEFMQYQSESIKIVITKNGLDIYQNDKLVFDKTDLNNMCAKFGALYPQTLKIVNHDTETVMQLIDKEFPFPKHDTLVWTGETNDKIKNYFPNLQ